MLLCSHLLAAGLTSEESGRDGCENLERTATGEGVAESTSHTQTTGLSEPHPGFLITLVIRTYSLVGDNNYVMRNYASPTHVCERTVAGCLGV